MRTLALPRLIALIDPRKVASLHMTEKIGMANRKDVSFPGYTGPDRLYVLAQAQRTSFPRVYPTISLNQEALGMELRSELMPPALDEAKVG